MQILKPVLVAIALILCVVLYSATAHCQDVVKVSPFPRPYLLADFDLMPAGYESTAWQGGGGIEVNAPHFVFDSYAGYDNGRKAPVNGVPNYNGHDRFLRGFAGYYQNGWFVGVGARWSQLSTSDYTKGGSPLNGKSWHPEFGFGWDAATDYARVQILYMFREQREVSYSAIGIPCVGCGNGSQGADITLWFPSPIKSNHWFCKMNWVPFTFHDTITDPKNLVQTAAQTASHHFTVSGEIGVGVRF